MSDNNNSNQGASNDAPQYIDRNELNQALNGYAARNKIDYDVLAEKVAERMANRASASTSTQASQAAPDSKESELQKQIESERKARQDLERSINEKSLLLSLKDELSSAGKLKKESLPLIVDIFKARGMLEPKTQTLRMGEQSVSVAEGVAQFLGSQEAQVFLEAAPKTAPKNGFTPFHSQTTRPLSEMSREERIAYKQAQLAASMKGQ